MGLLPQGLSLDSITGNVSGIISSGVSPGLYKFVIAAYSVGYPVQTFPFEMKILPQLDNPTMTMVSTVWFDLGKSILTSATKTVLNQMAIKFIDSGKKIIQVNGFTDGVSGQSDSALSLARADMVKRYIQTKIIGVKINSSGKGLAPSSKNSTKSMQLSRKAEIWVG
jgi:outer membrane protein OmpA-like peptidoglycan-associated protein